MLISNIKTISAFLCYIQFKYLFYLIILILLIE